MLGKRICLVLGMVIIRKKKAHGLEKLRKKVVIIIVRIIKTIRGTKVIKGNRRNAMIIEEVMESIIRKMNRRNGYKSVVKGHM